MKRVRRHFEKFNSRCSQSDICKFVVFSQIVEFFLLNWIQTLYTDVLKMKSITSFELRVHSTGAFERIIGRIELLNKCLCSALRISMILLFFTTLPYSLVRYYIFDMGENSFYLFFPSWWVFSMVVHKELNSVSLFLWTRLYDIGRSTNRVNANWWNCQICPIRWKRCPFNWETPSWLVQCTFAPWPQARRHYHPVLKFSVWVMLAFHFHYWGYYTRCGCIQ